jgi:putative nucleotidyltransferase with HDIG domain
MITKLPTSTCINGDTVAEDVYDTKGLVLIKKNTIIDSNLKNKLLDIGIVNLKINNPIKRYDNFDKLHKEIIVDVKDSLREVIFRKEYIHTRVTDYLARMYESIDDNSIIINALDRIKKIDKYTFKHSINTAFYSMFIAIWMGLTDQEIINATQAGILHDIGKIYIPNEILNKEASLTKEEYEIVKKHTLYGYFLLSEFGDFNQDVKRAVLFHHERKDSLGYPLNASPDYVGLISKIVSVADVYDAMTTDRIYKKASTPIDVTKFLNTDGRNILDMDVLNVFLTNIPVYDFKMNA